jgi:serpin B
MVVAGNTAFATALYSEAARSAGNVFFAPANISTALAMTYAGARGETAAEMARALHLPALDAPCAFGNSA